MKDRVEKLEVRNVKNEEYVFEKLEQFLGIGIVCAEEVQLKCLTVSQEYNPIYCSKKLQEILMDGADNQEDPFIYKDDHQVCFACIRYENKHYMIGPMCVAMLGRMELHQFYRDYGIPEDHEKRLKHYTISKVLGMIELMAVELLDQQYTDEKLLYANHIVEDTKENTQKEQVFFELQEEDEEIYHHTYQEERKLLGCVREGQVEEAVRNSKNMDVDLGKLSTRELNHWKNVAIAAITLCTRAAIEGGISPSIAYRLSDFYIQKSDSCIDIAQVVDNRNRAVEELTKRVRIKKETRSGSNYVEQCKDYIEKHYRQKIYLDEIADTLSISTSYLSKLFHKDVGMRLQDYIVKVRVEHAANLLMYSEESIARIAEYVNFPSQSYFGKVFKQYKNTSPRIFREMNKPSGF